MFFKLFAKTSQNCLAHCSGAMFLLNTYIK